MKQPKINIQLEPIDKIIELTAISGLVILFVLPIIYYSGLPERIPIHFGINGKPDSFSGKGMLWLLPILGLLIYAGMSWLNKYPHTFNYPQKITIANAKKQYQNATRLMRVITAITTCSFAYLTYSIIQIALGNQKGLGLYFLVLFLLLLFGSMGYFLKKAKS